MAPRPLASTRTNAFALVVVEHDRRAQQIRPAAVAATQIRAVAEPAAHAVERAAPLDGRRVARACATGIPRRRSAARPRAAPAAPAEPGRRAMQRTRARPQSSRFGSRAEIIRWCNALQRASSPEAGSRKPRLRAPGRRALRNVLERTATAEPRPNGPRPPRGRPRSSGRRPRGWRADRSTMAAALPTSRGVPCQASNAKGGGASSFQRAGEVGGLVALILLQDVHAEPFACWMS